MTSSQTPSDNYQETLQISQFPGMDLHSGMTRRAWGADHSG